MPIVRIATFNVSIEASNYSADIPPKGGVVKRLLADGSHFQLRNIAEIIQHVRPDIILLNEFDYIEQFQHGVKAFIDNYLNVNQQSANAIDYPYFYTAPVNSGEPSPYDIDGDGIASGTGGDAYGFGFYPGQYGMVLLSRFPIKTEQVRTFRKLRWASMPNPYPIKKVSGKPFYDESTFTGLRLSSKSHWDVPIQIGENTIHLLAAHPTPPVFDGPERRNRARNHDEIRLWADYLSCKKAGYIQDDNGQLGGLAPNEPFVIVGDYNASPDEGDSADGAIEQLLNHPRVNHENTPTSLGGKRHSKDNPYAASHTASWRARADYVLPSDGLSVIDSGVFWPPKGSNLYRLIANRNASSDHRLVWLDIKFES